MSRFGAFTPNKLSDNLKHQCLYSRMGTINKLSAKTYAPNSGPFSTLEKLGRKSLTQFTPLEQCYIFHIVLPTLTV